MENNEMDKQNEVKEDKLGCADGVCEIDFPELDEYLGKLLKEKKEN